MGLEINQIGLHECTTHNLNKHYNMSAQPVGDVTRYWIKPGQHPVKIHIQLTPHPIFRGLSTHNTPPSIFKLSSEELPISALPNSDPDNPPTRAFWEITSPCSVWVGRGFCPTVMQLVGFLPAAKNKSAVTSFQSPGAGPPPQRGSLCVGCSDLFASNSSSPDHICSSGPADPAEVNSRSGAS